MTPKPAAQSGAVDPKRAGDQPAVHHQIDCATLDVVGLLPRALGVDRSLAAREVMTQVRLRMNRGSS